MRPLRCVTAPVLVLLVVGACGGRAAVGNPPEDAAAILLAVAAEVRAMLPATELVALDTAGIARPQASAVAAVLGARGVQRSEVLRCQLPVCRLHGASALVSLAPPYHFASGRARVLVEIWSGAGPRGAAQAAFRLTLAREPGGGWVVTATEPAMAG